MATWMSKCCVAASARNRSAPAAAIVARSSGSWPGSGGVESNLASHSRSSTMRLSLPLSPSMRVSTARYSAGLRGALRATLVSALMTLSGVRSSWEASAENSSCRRRDCSTGRQCAQPDGECAAEHCKEEDGRRQRLTFAQQRREVIIARHALAGDEHNAVHLRRPEPERSVGKLRGGRLAGREPERGRQRRGARARRGDGAGCVWRQT